LFCSALAPNILVITDEGYRDLKAGAAGGDAIEALGEVLANMDTRRRLAIAEDPPGSELQKFVPYFPGRLEVFSRAQPIPVPSSVLMENSELEQHLWCVFTAAREMGLEEAEVLSLLSMENA
jgi:hypothetical protein